MINKNALGSSRFSEEDEFKPHSSIALVAWRCLLIALLLGSCYPEDSPFEIKDDPPITTIYGVEYVPQLVHVGDSVTFKVSIKDSTLDGLVYRWYFSGPFVYTTEPRVSVKIELPPRMYYFYVNVSKPNTQTESVTKIFPFEVLQ